MVNKEELAIALLCSIEKKGCKQLTSFLDDWTKGLFVILRVIQKSDNEVTAGFLSSTLGVSTARIAVALKTLEMKKWVKKYKSPTDARITIVCLTEYGEEVLKEKEKELIKIVTGFLNKLTDQEVNDLINIIKKTV